MPSVPNQPALQAASFLKASIVCAGLLVLAQPVALSVTAAVKAVPVPVKSALPTGRVQLKYDILSGCKQLNQQQQFYLTQGVRHIAAVFATRLDHRVDASRPVLIRLVCNESVFKKYQVKQFGRVFTGAGFYSYTPQKPEVVLLWKFGDQELYKGIFHEVTHHFLKVRAGAKGGPDFPFWFNEGVAGYFGNTQPHLNTLKVQISWRNVNVEKWVRENRFPAFRDLFKLKPERWASWVYTREMSESLIHFLMESKQGREVISQLIKDAYGKADLAQALAKRYPGGLDRLQKDWEAWLKAPRHQHVWTDLYPA
ncbi:MAG TPA: hypothetical protein V6D23_22140 [Candidatus Obscuribacterales bacterium]